MDFAAQTNKTHENTKTEQEDANDFTALCHDQIKRCAPHLSSQQ